MKLREMMSLSMMIVWTCLDGPEDHCQHWMLAPMLLVRVAVHVKNLRKQVYMLLKQHSDHPQLIWYLDAEQKLPEKLSEKTKVQAKLCLFRMLRCRQTVVEAVLFLQPLGGLWCCSVSSTMFLGLNQPLPRHT